MSFTDPDYIADILQGVLDVLTAAFDDADRSVDRVFRAPGPPAWECGLLAVYATPRVVSPNTQTDSKPIRAQIRHGLTITILLTRCLASASVNGSPTAAQIDADGVGYATDQWIMQRALTVAAQTNTLLPTGCTVARLNPVVPSSPQGGYSGMTATLEVSLG